MWNSFPGNTHFPSNTNSSAPQDEARQQTATRSSTPDSANNQSPPRLPVNPNSPNSRSDGGWPSPHRQRRVRFISQEIPLGQRSSSRASQRSPVPPDVIQRYLTPAGMSALGLTGSRSSVSSSYHDHTISSLQRAPFPRELNVESLFDQDGFVNFMQEWGLPLGSTRMNNLLGDEDNLAITDMHTLEIELSRDAFNTNEAYNLHQEESSEAGSSIETNQSTLAGLNNQSTLVSYDLRLNALSGALIQLHEQSHVEFLRRYPAMRQYTTADVFECNPNEREELNYAVVVNTYVMEILAHHSEVRNINAYLDRHELTLQRQGETQLLSQIRHMRDMARFQRDEFFLSLRNLRGGDTLSNLLLSGQIFSLLVLSQRNVPERLRPNSTARIRNVTAPAVSNEVRADQQPNNTK